MKKIFAYYWVFGGCFLALVGMFFGILGLQSMLPIRGLALNSPATSCLILGIHPNPGTMPDWTKLDQLELWQSKKNASITIYSATVTKYLDYTFGQLETTWNRGSIPSLSLEFWSDNPDNTTIETRIMQGELDGYFAEFRSRLMAYIAGPDQQLNTRDDRRIYLRPGHEANGNWYGWSGNPEAYIYAWRRMYGIVNPGFSKSQLQWIWSVNNTDQGGITAESYYPGDIYVDWFGIDGYNWGKSFVWGDWNSPNSIFDNMLTRLRVLSPNKPVSINEVSSTTTPNGVAAKNQWISTMFDYAYQNNIRMLSWFNEDKETDWSIFGGRNGDTTFQGQNVFSNYAAAVKDKRVIGSNGDNPRILTDKQFDGSQMCGATLILKAYLSGAWNIDKMKNLLNSKGLIPKTDPYNSNPRVTLEAIPTNIIDWVKIDLISPLSQVTKSGLLQSDGQVIEADGSNLGGLNVQPGLTNVIIGHRNHLAVSTASSIEIPASGQIDLDITTNENVKGGNQATLAPNTYGLKLGDANGDNLINAFDRSQLRAVPDQINTYSSFDLNMDGVVSSADRMLIRTKQDSLAIKQIPVPTTTPTTPTPPPTKTPLTPSTLPTKTPTKTPTKNPQS